MRYMGKFLLDRATSFNFFDVKREQIAMETNGKPNDDPQVFYSENHTFAQLKIDGEKKVISKYGRSTKVFSSLYEPLCSASDEKKFLTHHLRTFADTEWISKIHNRLAMLEN